MQTEKELTGYPSINKPWLKYYSEESIHAELPHISMYQYAFEKNKDNMSSYCFYYFNRKIRYNDFFYRIKSVASGLMKMGIGKGDIVNYNRYCDRKI